MGARREVKRPSWEADAETKGPWAVVGCEQRGFGAQVNNESAGEGASRVITKLSSLGSSRGAVQGQVQWRACCVRGLGVEF